ncbi:MAG TPA: universal stress protein [Candidatus Bathyarchaeia archaeon]|jgi:nucleotide-binding universal stress UspA family protein|nr:universal stress protein [Candidatus Bathyarchaeia archaeon]
MSVSLPKKILAAVDGSEPSLKAVSYAAQLAKLTDSKLLVLTVILLPSSASLETVERVRKDLSTKAKEILERSKSAAKQFNVDPETKIVETDRSVVETIVGSSESERADLIVLGSKGVTMGKMMLGSIAAGTVNLSRLSVLVAR